MTPLKHWSLNRTIPTIDDTESLSVLELVGKNTTKINELIKDYNEFVDEINLQVEEFENSITKDHEEFKNCITKIMHDYIMKIDDKIKMQDLVIDNAVKYMKDNINSTCTSIINELILNGDIQITHTYNSENKKVSLIIKNMEVSN